MNINPNLPCRRRIRGEEDPFLKQRHREAGPLTTLLKRNSVL